MMVLKIESPEALAEAIRLNSWLRRPNLRRLDLELPGLDWASNRDLERRLSKLFNECGCHWAAFVLIISLTGVGTAYVRGLVLTWPGFGLLILGSVFLSFVAKLAALYWSQRSLGRELVRLHQYF